MSRKANKKSITRQWKKAEQRGAEFFGSVRTPLSGGNSKQTRSDSLSTLFYLEQKAASSFAAWSLFDDTRKKARAERKVPAVLLHRHRSPGFLICIHSSDLDRFIRQYMMLRKDQREASKDRPQR